MGLLLNLSILFILQLGKEREGIKGEEEKEEEEEEKEEEKEEEEVVERERLNRLNLHPFALGLNKVEETIHKEGLLRETI